MYLLRYKGSSKRVNKIKRQKRVRHYSGFSKDPVNIHVGLSGLKLLYNYKENGFDIPPNVTIFTEEPLLSTLYNTVFRKTGSGQHNGIIFNQKFIKEKGLDGIKEYFSYGNYEELFLSTVRQLQEGRVNVKPMKLGSGSYKKGTDKREENVFTYVDLHDGRRKSISVLPGTTVVEAQTRLNRGGGLLQKLPTVTDLLGPESFDHNVLIVGAALTGQTTAAIVKGMGLGYILSGTRTAPENPGGLLAALRLGVSNKRNTQFAHELLSNLDRNVIYTDQITYIATLLEKEKAKTTPLTDKEKEMLDIARHYADQKGIDIEKLVVHPNERGELTPYVAATAFGYARDTRYRLEAQALGLPVVSIHIPGGPDFVRDLITSNSTGGGQYVVSIHIEESMKKILQLSRQERLESHDFSTLDMHKSTFNDMNEALKEHTGGVIKFDSNAFENIKQEIGSIELTDRLEGEKLKSAIFDVIERHSNLKEIKESQPELYAGYSKKIDGLLQNVLIDKPTLKQMQGYTPPQSGRDRSLTL